ncbi:universal stress protein containing UspA domain [Psychromonas ingrahamii 37]|uniref:Universal stress protein containing UspA domain n=1 Tax=Psychromonas ingrahamii (strain DSM 17664 / CCUG 51855 / 37) TaxID=357804 RepID=A1SY79_PSYIN|nr:universal stress protein [Psychromonas ingrahamii]ABM04444.1 universal stress protein containing UspA domain [Psychromonas ingrahamii 37]
MSLKHILMPVDLAFNELVEREVSMALKLLDDDGVIDILFVDDTASHRRMAITAVSDRLTEKHSATELAVQAMFDAIIPKWNRGRCIIRHGAVSDEVVAQAKKSNADAIVMASAKPKFRSYLLGSNAAKIVRHAHCSVFVVR